MTRLGAVAQHNMSVKFLHGFTLGTPQAGACRIGMDLNHRYRDRYRYRNVLTIKPDSDSDTGAVADNDGNTLDRHIFMIQAVCIRFSMVPALTETVSVLNVIGTKTCSVITDNQRKSKTHRSTRNEGKPQSQEVRP